MSIFPHIEVTHKRPSIYGPFTVLRSKKDGRPFLKTEKTTLWDINGFLIQTKKRRILIVFKRKSFS